MYLFFITQDFPPETGGIQTYSFELCKGLRKHVDSLSVITTAQPKAAEFDRNQPFDILRIPVSNPLLFLPLLLRLPQLIKKRKTKLTFHAQWQTVLPALLCKKMGILNHIVVAAHGRELLFNPFGSGLAGSLYTKYMHYILKQADRWLAVSNFTAGLLMERGVLAEKINVIPNGTDPEVFYPKKTDKTKLFGVPANRKILLSVTRLVGRKGIDLALKALPEVLKQFPDLLYVIAGVGPEMQRLTRLRDELGLGNNVQFAGRLPYASLINYYNACDVFLLPSKTAVPDVEGFGIVFLEANACAKPVIGTTSGGIPDAVIHEKTGLIVQEGDVKALSQAMLKLLNNPEFANKMGKNGLKRVQSELNWKEISKKVYEALMQELSTGSVNPQKDMP